MKTPLKCRLKNWFRFRPISPSKAFYYNCAFGLKGVSDRCVHCSNRLYSRTEIDAFFEGLGNGLKSKGVKVND